jgi:hypothetical protein
MITTRHLSIYKSFNGDIDAWVRVKDSNDPMTSDIWFEIEGILQNLTLIKNGFASREFTAQTLQQLKSACETSEVEVELIEMSKQR